MPGWRSTRPQLSRAAAETGDGTHMSRLMAAFLTALTLLLGAPALAWAHDDHQGVRWEELSPEQRELLKELAPRWNELPKGRQEAIARSSKRWLSTPPEQRASLQRRMERRRSLDSEERRQVRRRMQQFHQLQPEEQERIRRTYKRFQQLEPHERKRLRREFRDLPPEERRRWLERMLEECEQSGPKTDAH